MVSDMETEERHLHAPIMSVHVCTFYIHTHIDKFCDRVSDERQMVGMKWTAVDEIWHVLTY